MRSWQQSGRQSWAIRESLAMRVGAQRVVNIVQVEGKHRSCTNEGGIQGVGGEASEMRVPAGERGRERAREAKR